jgi:hypothetical protein
MEGIMNRFIKCFLFINIACITGVVAQDKLASTTSIKTVPIVKSDKFVPEKVVIMGVLMPPPEYIYKSDKYVLIVEELSDPNAKCKEIFATYNVSVHGATVMACSEKHFTKEGKMLGCTNYLPLKTLVPEQKWWALYMHELAHCNGWSHPDPFLKKGS